MVYDTVDGENNQLEKTMEVAGIRIYHYCWNFFEKGCDMLCVVMVVEMKTVSSFFPTTLRSCVLVVDDTVDGKDN